MSFLLKCIRPIYQITQRFNHLIATNLQNYRSLISIKGKESAKFLQGLTTNDIRLLNDNNRIQYSMILNTKGRVKFDVLIYNLQKNDSEQPHYLIEVDSKLLNESLRFFKVYNIKNKVEIAQIRDEHKLYAIHPSINSQNFKLEFKNEGANNFILYQTDPRYSPLGYRFILPSNIQINNVLNSVNESNDTNDYEKLLCKQGIAENSKAVSYEQAIALEYNIVFLNGVSFNKGCYLGQELIAKAHFTGVIRKRIMPFTLQDESVNCKFSSDNEIINVKTNKPIGKVKIVHDKFGIGLVRLANIDNENTVIVDDDGHQHKIKLRIPEYWQMNEALENELKTAII